MLEALSTRHFPATLSVAAALLSSPFGASAEVLSMGPARNLSGGMITSIRPNEQRTASNVVVRGLRNDSAIADFLRPRIVTRAEDAALRKAAFRSSRLVSRGRLVAR